MDAMKKKMLHNKKPHTKFWGFLFWGILPFCIAFYVIFTHLGMMPLLNPDEARNASIASEMQIANTWLIPTYNGLPYLDKPALFFKLIACSLSFFGHSAFSARFPSAFFAICLLIATFFFCRKFCNLRTAGLSVMIASTTPLFYVFARYVIFDMTLAFFVSAAIFSGFIAETVEKKYQWVWYFICSVMMGMATLTKGPIGFILPLLVLAVFNYFDKKEGANARLFSWKNWAILLLIVLPWFIGVSLKRPDFPYYGLVLESFKRFTSGEFHREKPVYYYFLIIAGTFLFWNFIYPSALYYYYKNKNKILSIDRLCLIWFFCIALFFSLSQSKLPGYILTITIPFSISIARFLNGAFSEKKSPDMLIFNIGVYLYGAILFLISFLFFYFYFNENAIYYLFKKIDNKNYLDHIQELSLFFGGIYFLIGLMVFLLKKNIKVIFFGFILFSAFAPISFYPGYAAFSSKRSNIKIEEYLTLNSKKNDIFTFLCFPPGFPFYLKKDIKIVTRGMGVEISSNYIPYFISKLSSMPFQIINKNNFLNELKKENNASFVIVDQRDEKIFKNMLSQYNIKCLLKENQYEIYVVRSGKK